MTEACEAPWAEVLSLHQHSSLVGHGVMTRPLVKPIALDHVVLKCTDVDRSLNFYIDILGLEPVRVDEWRNGAAPFPSVRINQTAIIDLFPSEPHGTNVDHICIVVERFDHDDVVSALPGSRSDEHLFGARRVTPTACTSVTPTETSLSFARTNSDKYT